MGPRGQAGQRRVRATAWLYAIHAGRVASLAEAASIASRTSKDAHAGG
eukprot:CAMPEP_0170284740 /NCGR_PEP_ID=MMETSP0116_2-20130129/42409_1 /TAXON_ID=400756 /ORGANISM="Durinskia baltica, Strain CSIRO CS-38" /LENGTH=47 /DNA_ID= /DNA_START= /DNA_END= /DNA_ORIENTATION=